MEAIGSQSLLSFSSNICKPKLHIPLGNLRIKNNARRLEVLCYDMLAPRKFMRKKKKEEIFANPADELKQKSWRKMMKEIETSGSAVESLRKQKNKAEVLPKDLVLGTLVRFKQLKKWDIVSEILEWLRTQHWWKFSEMDFLMLITAYGKLASFDKAERLMKYMNKSGFAPSVISHTALMEAYGRAKQYTKAESIFRRMQSDGPSPSPLTYQIILKTFAEGDKYMEAEAVFESLLKEERPPFKPDQKMFHMMIYMYKKAGNYQKAHKLFSEMAVRGIPQSTVTFNSLMSFETDYKEVSNIYDLMQRSGARPDVVSYSLLIRAYGKARRESEALAVFEEMLDAGVMPTRKAYNILLDAFAISGMVDEARTVFKRMRRNRCEPDLYSYTTMVSAYVNACDMNGAEKFFRQLKDDGLKPNVVVYGTLMKGYAEQNNLEKVVRVYERMQAQGVSPNATIYTTLMDAHGKNLEFSSAVAWYKEMVEKRIEPDKKAKNILLSLAQMPEEKLEANQLVGVEASCEQLELLGGDVNVTDDNLEKEDAKEIKSDSHEINADPYYNEEEDEEDYNDDDDDVDEDDFGLVSFKDRKELALTS
ncbi:Pentatricopeptide repeat-containing protein [Rhynchospora pubera]|uniref:Pentatricopeptide repeat-containing protein n=1 Tax=Rhynchospora pubera TaxID=906938 RepID=A0AAV8HEA6_9POAL|nr:Pentatricopeptide repeat-containing protein [Rhynchospora pubera]